VKGWEAGKLGRLGGWEAGKLGKLGGWAANDLKAIKARLSSQAFF
jgi:hypothetical protein